MPRSEQRRSEEDTLHRMLEAGPIFVSRRFESTGHRLHDHRNDHFEYVFNPAFSNADFDLIILLVFYLFRRGHYFCGPGICDRCENQEE